MADTAIATPDSWLTSIAESTDLHALTEIVRKGRRTAVEVGIAMWRIKTGRLFKSTHSTWESWCKDNWFGSKRAADRLIQVARVSSGLGRIVPKSHAEILDRVPEEHRQAVVEEAGPGATREDIERVASTHGVVPAHVEPAGPPPPNEDLSQWDCRPDLARWFVEWTGVTDTFTILEPSAGLGRIAIAARDAGANVQCVEIDPARVHALESAGFDVRCADFLDFATEGPGDQYHAALMNPPYEDGQDLEHILAALRLAPIVCVIARLVLLEGKERKARLWDKHSLTRLCCFSEREPFDGVVAGSPRSAFAAFEIHRGAGWSIVDWR